MTMQTRIDKALSWDTGRGGAAALAALALWPKAMLQSNLELVALWSQWGRIWLDHPTALVRCRTAQDVLDANIDASQRLAEAAVAAAQRIYALWMPASAQVTEPAAPRDYITFPEPPLAEFAPREPAARSLFAA